MAALLELLEHRIAHFRQGEHSVANPGREARHGSIEMVAAAGVALGIDSLELPLARGPSAANRAQGSVGFGKQSTERLVQGLAVREAAG